MHDKDMVTNKLKLLTISLFLNNTKSVHLQRADGTPYRYVQPSDINMIQKPNNPLLGITHISDLEFIVNQDTVLIMSEILKNFISEMLELSINFDNPTFTIQNTFDGTETTYRITKENNLTKIKIDRPDQTIATYEKINCTVLALSYINSPNMQLFLGYNAYKNKNIPNSNVFIDKGNWLVADTMNHCFYIFNENDIEAKKNIERLLCTKEAKKEKEEIVPLFDKRNLTFQNIMMVLTLCTTIIVPLIVAQMTKK